ncbi:MAG: hypothetical protein BZ135_05425 [Methanosphaera sp. rholeuAM6]|nr:MAG: hypothetical protein BZ135_05425 [Methanosphaera sp. rholeuAM6]
MEPATTLAIIILVVAILILLYYYLQSVNSPIYESIHSQAAGLSSRVSQEEYISSLSDRVTDFSGKFKDRVQDEDEDDHISKTDVISNKISQFINEQSEQVIADWDLVTHKDFDSVLERFDALKDDFDSFVEVNDSRVSDLEARVDRIEEDLRDLRK